MKYLLDEDGYVVVEFVDHKKDDFRTPEEAIPNKLIIASDAGKLNREMLLDADYTDVIRLGLHPSAKDMVRKELGIRGVPLKPQFRLKPHQTSGLAWMQKREALPPESVYGLRGGVLSMEQGLGKTLTALVHCLSAPKGEFPTLIVASKTVMREWQLAGVTKFFGDRVKALYLHKDYLGSDIERITRKDVLQYDFVLTTYDVCMTVCKKGVSNKKGSSNPFYTDCLEIGGEHTLMKDKVIAVHTRSRNNADNSRLKGPAVIYGTPWERVICDESQRYANVKTETYKCIMALYGKYKWCLTGTPIRNYDTDIWAQLRFLGYNAIEQATMWKRNGSAKMNEHRLREAIFTMNYVDAGITLPAKYEHVRYVDSSKEEKEAYEYILGVTRKVYDDMMNKLVSFSCVLALFTRLRQCAIAPYLMTSESKREKLTGKDAEDDKQALGMLLTEIKTDTTMGKWVHNKKSKAGMYSSKITEVIETFKLIPKGEKVIVFSAFTSCLDLLADAIEERYPEFKVVQVDGDTTGQERSDLLDRFRADPTIRACFLTYKVGSEGLNLIEANHVLCMEPWWTDAVHAQARSRSYRMGQEREVIIHHVYNQGTLEERVVEICKEKNEMAASYLSGTQKPVKASGLDKATLGRILGIRR